MRRYDHLSHAGASGNAGLAWAGMGVVRTPPAVSASAAAKNADLIANCRCDIATSLLNLAAIVVVSTPGLTSKVLIRIDERQRQSSSRSGRIDRSRQIVRTLDPGRWLERCRGIDRTLYVGRGLERIAKRWRRAVELR